MIPTTSKQVKDTLFKALNQKTFYWNEYPYNLGFYHNNGKFSFDCVNLLKAILNGWEVKKTVGYYQHSLVITGDVNELQFINKCSDVSYDFTKLKELSALYMNGHIGAFVEEYSVGDKVYNTIECTSNNVLGDGVVKSFVDSNGYRRPYKGSPNNCGRWERHGTLKTWVKYETEKIDYQLVLRIAMKIEKGDYGNNPKRKETIVNKYGETYYKLAQGVINYIHS